MNQAFIAAIADNASGILNVIVTGVEHGIYAERRAKNELVAKQHMAQVRANAHEQHNDEPTDLVLQRRLAAQLAAQSAAKKATELAVAKANLDHKQKTGLGPRLPPGGGRPFSIVRQSGETRSH